MLIQTQNVQALPRMRPDEVIHDVNLTATQSDLIGWQEISIDYYREAVRSLDPKVWDSLMIKDLGNIGGCPISWKRQQFKLIDSGKIELFNGLPGIGKTRFIIWVDLQHIQSGAIIRVFNTHYVSKGYSRKRVTFRKLRQNIWEKSNAKLIKAVNAAVSDGYLVVILGDFNRMFFAPVGNEVLGHKVLNCNAPASIDKVILIGSEWYEWHNPHFTNQGGTKNSDHKGVNVGTIIKKRR